MTPDEIIRMAQGYEPTFTWAQLQAAVLAEREACAKVCEEVDVNNKGFPLNAKTYAAAIRARNTP